MTLPRLSIYLLNLNLGLAIILSDFEHANNKKKH
jgi:hypothetical protein